MWLATAVFIITLTFIITNPFALLDWNCDAITPAVRIGPVRIPALNWHSCYLDNISRQSGMVSGEGDLAFTRQYSGTVPYLYPIEMQLRWGMGWLLGILAFIGFIWFMQYAIRHTQWRMKDEGRMMDDQQPTSFIRRLQVGYHLPDDHKLYIILLTWVLPFFLVTGGFYVKFMRYMQPLTPFLMLFAAAMVWQWWRFRWVKAGVGLVLLFTGLYAFSFVNMYRQPHPWELASEWVYRQVPEQTIVLSEQWDDALPTGMVVDGEPHRRDEYQDIQLTWMTGPDAFDNPEKLARNLARLEAAEYMTLVTNRVYGVVPRLPERYPLSSQYHQLLFDGDLGYEVVSINGRFPHLFGFHIKPNTFDWPSLVPSDPVVNYLDGFPGINNGRADESFLVYDQPLTIIFKNVEHKTADEMQLLFE